MDGQDNNKQALTDDQTHEHSTADYARYTPPQKPDRGARWLIALLIVIALAIIGAATYWFIFRQEGTGGSSTGQQATQQQSPSTPAGNSTGGGQIDSQTTHYTSTDFGLSFDYPANWALTDPAGSGKLTVVSPPLKLTDANGQTVTGQIVFMLRDAKQKLTEFAAGNAVAALLSQKIAYTNPTAVQRGNTYISFLRYASDLNSGDMNGVYITGDFGYQKGQAIPETDVAKVNPNVSITFQKCADAGCTAAGTPMSIALSSWNDTNFSQPLLKMLKSLSIQP